MALPNYGRSRQMIDDRDSCNSRQDIIGGGGGIGGIGGS